MRSRESIGAPLITPAGELFTIGGYGAVFWFSLLFYTFIFAQLRMARYLLGYNAVYVGAMFVITYNVTFTGTALGLSILSFRSLPLLLIAVLLITRRGNLPARSPLTRQLKQPFGTAKQGQARRSGF